MYIECFIVSIAALAKVLKHARRDEEPGAIFLGLNEANQTCLVVLADKSESYKEMKPRLAALNARVQHHHQEVCQEHADCLCHV